MGATMVPDALTAINGRGRRRAMLAMKQQGDPG